MPGEPDYGGWSNSPVSVLPAELYSSPAQLCWSHYSPLARRPIRSASRGLWQHAPSMFLFFAALLVYDVFPAGSGSRLALGIIVGYSYVVRPGNSLLVIGFFILLSVTGRRWLAAYSAGVVIGVVPLFAFNLSECVWNLAYFYYRLLASSLGHGIRYSDAYLGLLLSPSRGLLVFSPFTVLVLVRLTKYYRSRYPWTRGSLLASL